ncbi:MAG: hypothetical protein ACRDJM_07995 [Actinomycetota bacterium]
MRRGVYGTGATIAAIALVLAPALGPTAGIAATRTCNGFAPTTTSCTTGTQTRTTVTVVHDVSADINYIGTVESAMVWSFGSRIFRCTYAPGADRRCLGLGDFPPVGASFTHRCRSLIPGTAFSATPEITLDGVEGGLGTWSCTVTV